jgi:hypothetical protein
MLRLKANSATKVMIKVMWFLKRAEHPSLDHRKGVCLREVGPGVTASSVRRVVVTGASNGIGQAIARALDRKVQRPASCEGVAP